jgi:hypothetical protein
MRLTNVAQMQLADGRVFRYVTHAVPRSLETLPISYDQARHVGQGQRPGSWMALAFRLTVPATSDELAAAWDAVIARHGTLRSVFVHGPGDGLTLHPADVAAGSWEEHPVGDGQQTRDVLRAVLDADCAPFASPSYRLCRVDPQPAADDQRTEVIVGSDHAHVDMWSLVVLARDLVTCVDDLRAHRPLGAALPQPRAFAAHTAQLAAMPSAPQAIHQRWADILAAGDGTMPTFPLPLGALSPVPPEVVEVRDVLDAAATERFAALAAAHGVRMLALGISVLTQVTAACTGEPLRAVFPVHSRHEPGWQDAVGWFITNAVIESADPAPTACAAAVREAMSLGSWPLAPILAPYGPDPSRPGLFAISWLDTRRLPVPAEQATQLRYVSATIHTDGVMIWFLVSPSGLHLRCRYPDTPQARTNVGRWLDDVQTGLQTLAGDNAPEPDAASASR